MSIPKVIFILLTASCFVVACNAPNDENTAVEISLELRPQDDIKEAYTKLYVNTEESSISWSGSKMMGTHHGTIDIAIGTLLLDNRELKGGKFIIDMNTIENLDLKGTWPHDGLLEQLKSPDFFSVDSFPIAIFEMTAVEPLEDSTATHTISGNLTIKKITHNISSQL